MNENQKTDELLLAAPQGRIASAWHRNEQAPPRRSARSDREAWLSDAETQQLLFTFLADVDAVLADCGRDDDA